VNLVIDASVLIKFYVPEILSDKAVQLFHNLEGGNILLLAPDLIYPEMGNILWKKQQRGELIRSEVEEITDAILSLPLTIEISKPLVKLAVDISMGFGITVYDALYLSLAMVQETKILTADKKLVTAMAKTDLRKYIMWLGGWGEVKSYQR
jgi:predicted nucleic acid-binding protein